jgi:hypothetical protein
MKLYSEEDVRFICETRTNDNSKPLRDLRQYPLNCPDDVFEKALTRQLAKIGGEKKLAEFRSSFGGKGTMRNTAAPVEKETAILKPGNLEKEIAKAKLF